MDRGLHLKSGRVELADGERSFRLQVDDFRLVPGQAVALTGASGSGKTLLLELLGLLRAPAPGAVYHWEGEKGSRDLAALWSKGARGAELARMRGALFGFVPQTGGLVPFLTVSENIALPQKVTGRLDANRVNELIERLEIADVAGLRPAALSIGQRQRTAIARALAHCPPFVVADEPTAALDPEAADRVLTLLLETAEAQKTGVILSSHDLDRVARFRLERHGLVVSNDPVVSRLEPVAC